MRGFLSDASIISRTLDCDNYFELIPAYAFETVTEDEKQFPLAIGHSVHSQAGILEMFLALNFRYIHTYSVIDRKTF